MQPASKKLERIVLAGLAVVILGITFAFIRSRTGPQLPVLNQLSDFSLTNQNGKIVSLQDLRGTVWIADIIFTRCPAQCARMSKNMATLQRDLPNVKFVSLTADPGFDTPDILKTYAKHFDATDNWTFLTGTKSNVYWFAMDGLKLAVDERKPEERDNINDLFIHSKNFMLVDKKGQLRAGFEGDEPENNPAIIAAAKALLAE
jgi:protein SCO1/2